MGEKSCEQSYNLILKIGTATGVAMSKNIATSLRRPKSASDGCKIVRSVSRFCSNYPGLTNGRLIANDLSLSHKLLGLICS